MSNRVKRFTFSSALFFNILHEGNEIHVKCIKGLPNDAKFVRVTSENVFGIDLIFSSDSFPELKDGDEIPIERGLFKDLTHLLPADWEHVTKK